MSLPEDENLTYDDNGDIVMTLKCKLTDAGAVVPIRYRVYLSIRNAATGSTVATVTYVEHVDSSIAESLVEHLTRMEMQVSENWTGIVNAISTFHAYPLLFVWMKEPM